MSKKIKKLIKKYKNRLEWPLEIVSVPGHKKIEILSDHEARTHIIHKPDYNVRDIELLHEIGHAWLCENVSNIFSSQYFEPNIPEFIEMLTPASNSACDWFVDEWIFTLAPEEIKREISEHAKIMRNLAAKQKEGSAMEFCAAAYLVAQDIKYCGQEYKIKGSLGKAVNFFLNTNPVKPSLKKMTSLVNDLLSLYAPICVEAQKDKAGLVFWKITQRLN